VRGPRLPQTESPDASGVSVPAPMAPIASERPGVGRVDVLNAGGIDEQQRGRNGGLTTRCAADTARRRCAGPAGQSKQLRYDRIACPAVFAHPPIEAC
jgi:hypothetical protein